jgi:transcription antitermination protein NusB
MQAIYGLKQAEKANYYLALDQISDQFQPDLNSMETQDRQKLEGLRHLASLTFEDFFEKKEGNEDQNVPDEAERAAKQALVQYREWNKKDRQRISRSMIEEVDAIYDTYLTMLTMVLEMADVAVWDEQRRLLEAEHKTSQLAENTLINHLRELPEYQQERIRRNVALKEEERTLVKKIFRENLLQDVAFQQYLRKKQPTFEEELEAVNLIVREHFFKNDTFKSFFEEQDNLWNENKDILKNLLVKTFKITTMDELKLMPIAMNWVDDQFFFRDLYNLTLDNETEYETFIASQSKNWESDRVALLDMVLMKMALAEMIHFSSIPVKVTINEFIELAKEYSTPKSGTFLNGMLDSLSNRLIKEQVIRKSGRGLIDNK